MATPRKSKNTKKVRSLPTKALTGSRARRVKGGHITKTHDVASPALFNLSLNGQGTKVKI